MKTIRVNLDERSYDIHIGIDLPIGGCVAGETGLSALVVSDSNVAPLHGESCEERLCVSGLQTQRAEIPAGESSKNLDVVRGLYDRALNAGLDRASVIVALGGGMVGDVAGFMAATFLRGVRLIQVPTSLLAMVDSSVGGKTGVNVPQGKNLIGAFYQPVEVVADLSLLKTLPDREYVSGLAEVVKYGVIRDAGLFESLEKNTDALLARDTAVLETIIARCCEIKAEVVVADERESGLRAILNFGHTLGHALENILGYGEWLHGEAVAVGMMFAAEVSVSARGLSADACRRLKTLLEALGLPTRPRPDKAGLEWTDLREAMTADKKTRGKALRFVLADDIGSVTFGCKVAEDVLADAFKKMTC